MEEETLSNANHVVRSPIMRDFPLNDRNELPVVADQSLEGAFSYYSACPQRCIQRCHYST